MTAPFFIREADEQPLPLAPGLRPLTARQADVLRLLVARWPVQPTQREMAASLGLPHHQAVFEHLRLIARKGYIHRAGLARGITILFDADGQPFRCAPAGPPAEWPRALVTSRGDVLLRQPLPSPKKES